MKNQEIIIRVVIEQASTKQVKEKAVKPEREVKHRNTGKKLSRAMYTQLLALPNGGILDITEEAARVKASKKSVADRIEAYTAWLNKRNGTSNSYAVAKTESGRIHVARVS